MGLAGISVGLFVLHSLAARVHWEKDRTVEICVDGSEIQSLTDQNDGDTWDMLETLRAAGVSSVAVYWDPTRRLSDLLSEWAPRVPDGLTVTVRPEPVPFSDWSKGWPRAARPLKEGPRVQNVLFSGEAVMGYPDLTLVKEWLAPTDYRLPWVEFGRQRGMASLQQIFPENIKTDKEGYLSASYGAYDPMLVESIKALKELIDIQKEEIKMLKERMGKLASEIERLKAGL